MKKFEELDDLHKRLIEAQALGIAITHGDGHRWLDCHDDLGDWITFAQIMEKAKIAYNRKCYGNLYDVLNFIDHLLKKAGCLTLLERWEDKYKDKSPDDWYWAINSPNYTGGNQDADYFESRCNFYEEEK